MYSEKLNASKLWVMKKENRLVGIEYGEDKIIEIIDDFCRKEDVIGVPTPTLFSIFDQYCEENGYPAFNHLTLGIVFQRHFNLKRKRVRDGKTLYWVYVSAANN